MQVIAGQRTGSLVTRSGVTTTTSYAYDGLRLLGLAASASTGATWSVDYLYDERGTVFAGVYAASDASPTTFVLETTDRGDVRELLDASGRPFAYYGFDPLGAKDSVISSDTPSVPTTVAAAITSRQPLRYAGYVWDDESGMYYCSARYYDPSVGAFISKDPARADGEESAYQYCGGDPVGRVDPSGLWAASYHSGVTLRQASRFYGSAYAQRIAAGSQALDDMFSFTNPVASPEKHFNAYDHSKDWNQATYSPGSPDSRREYLDRQRSEAHRLWKRGKEKDALYELGKGIHALQDCWAHGNLKWASGHFGAPKCKKDGLALPDCPHWRTWRVQLAASKTGSVVKAFKDAHR